MNAIQLNIRLSVYFFVPSINLRQLIEVIFELFVGHCSSLIWRCIVTVARPSLWINLDRRDILFRSFNSWSSGLRRFVVRCSTVLYYCRLVQMILVIFLRELIFRWVKSVRFVAVIELEVLLVLDVAPTVIAIELNRIFDRGWYFVFMLHWSLDVFIVHVTSPTLI